MIWTVYCVDYFSSVKWNNSLWSRKIVRLFVLFCSTTAVWQEHNISWIFDTFSGCGTSKIHTIPKCTLHMKGNCTFSGVVSWPSYYHAEKHTISPASHKINSMRKPFQCAFGKAVACLLSSMFISWFNPATKISVKSNFPLTGMVSVAVVSSRPVHAELLLLVSLKLATFWLLQPLRHLRLFLLWFSKEFDRNVHQTPIAEVIHVNVTSSSQALTT